MRPSNAETSEPACTKRTMLSMNGVELLLGIEAVSSQIDEVAEALNELHEVYGVSFTTGRFSIFAWLLVRSMNDVATLLNKTIGNIPGIGHVVTFCCIETKKRWTATSP